MCLRPEQRAISLVSLFELLLYPFSITTSWDQVPIMIIFGVIYTWDRCACRVMHIRLRSGCRSELHVWVYGGVLHGYPATYHRTCGGAPIRGCGALGSHDFWFFCKWWFWADAFGGSLLRPRDRVGGLGNGLEEQRRPGNVRAPAFPPLLSSPLSHSLSLRSFNPPTPFPSSLSSSFATVLPCRQPSPFHYTVTTL